MTYIKDPDAVLDYSVDWSLWLAGDVIATSEWILAPDTDLEAAVDTKTASKATVWLRGGVAGTTYLATNRIVTAGGRTDDRTISIKVQDR